MKTLKHAILAFLAMALLGAGSLALADSSAHSTVGMAGYDLLSYRTGEKPVRGNGNHIAVHEGVTYLFVSEENRKMFERNPDKCLPAFGGYCAYLDARSTGGTVSVGKKFVGDPDVWQIVDGQLYVNLDNKIKGLWIEDVAGNIKKANNNWPRIHGTAPSDL